MSGVGADELKARINELAKKPYLFLFIIVAGAAILAWGAKAGYDYVDKKWFSQRCSVLREEQVKIAEKTRLEEAGLIQPTPHYFPTSSELPTYEEYKKREKWGAEMTADIFKHQQRLKDCGLEPN